MDAELRDVAAKLTLALECHMEIQQLLRDFLEVPAEEREEALQKLVDTLKNALGQAALLQPVVRRTLQEEHCNVSLHDKIGQRVGRLQLIVAALLDLARSYHDPDVVDYPLDALMGLAGEYGESWLDETAMLLKEWYNRGSGP
jgi:hypothetical protein